MNGLIYLIGKIRVLSIYTLGVIAAPFYLIMVFSVALYARRQTKLGQKPRIVWGPTPIINNHYWSIAMRKAGYMSETYTFDFYPTISKREDWDRILSEEYGHLPFVFKIAIAFISSLLKYDVFVIPFSGYFLGVTPLWFMEAFIFKVANKKVIVIPYGADAFVYKNVTSPLLAHGLMLSYPQAARRQLKIERRVNYWVQHADAMTITWMCPDGVGRWDVLPVSPLCIDLEKWKVSSKDQHADGYNDTVYIAHAPNHRGFKGTEFVIDAVESLKAEGLKVELIVIENLLNEEVRNIFENKVDILIDQLIFTGYSFNTIEGMASGITTICNLEDPTYTTLMRRWSFLGECSLVSSSPEKIKDTLRKLVQEPQLRKTLGLACREYVEKYHGLDSAQFLFMNIIDYIYNIRGPILNLYHPLSGEYKRDEPRIVPPNLGDD